MQFKLISSLSSPTTWIYDRKWTKRYQFFFDTRRECWQIVHECQCLEASKNTGSKGSHICWRFYRASFNKNFANAYNDALKHRRTFSPLKFLQAISGHNFFLSSTISPPSRHYFSFPISNKRCLPSHPPHIASFSGQFATIELLVTVLWQSAAITGAFIIGFAIMDTFIITASLSRFPPPF